MIIPSECTRWFNKLLNRDKNSMANKKRQSKKKITYENKEAKFFLTADILLIEKFNDFEKENNILLIKRKYDPFKDKWALPGGHLEITESIKDCAIRELKEETGFEILNKDKLFNSGVYGDIGRDPRGRYVSFLYTYVFNKNDNPYTLKAADDASDFKWFKISEVPIELAFDHRKMIDDVTKGF